MQSTVISEDHLQAVRGKLSDPTVAGLVKDTLVTRIEADLQDFLRADSAGRAVKTALPDETRRNQFARALKAHLASVLEGVPDDERYAATVRNLHNDYPELTAIGWIAPCWRHLQSLWIPALMAAGPDGETTAAAVTALAGMASFDIESVMATRAEIEIAAQRDQMQSLAKHYEQEIKELGRTGAKTSQELRTGVESLAKTVNEISTYLSTSVDDSQTTWGNVQAVASAAEEMSLSIQHISKQVEESREVTQEAVQNADQTNSTIEGMQQAANEIGKIVELISDIASQTNLLALNATIEASRAGEAGRGFAVVASEVKSLANQTKKATEDIANEISNMQAVTTQAVSALESVGGTIKKVEEFSNSVASAIEEQSSASQEISQNVHDAAAGTQHMSDHMKSMAENADQIGQQAQSLIGFLDQIDSVSEGFDAKIRELLSELRTMSDPEGRDSAPAPAGAQQDTASPDTPQMTDASSAEGDPSAETAGNTAAATAETARLLGEDSALSADPLSQTG